MHAKDTLEPVAAYSALDWQTGWNPEIGLWTQDYPGHCPSVANLPRVHSGPNATMRLLIAAQAGCLDRIDVHAVLQAIRKTQIQTNESNRGRLYWYMEEQSLADDHAIFFNGMCLLPLWGVYRDKLHRDSCAVCETILREMWHYAMVRVRHRNIYYPNQYLGYLMCAWLTSEFFGIEEGHKELPGIMTEAAEYWLAHGWGWGEHLSNVYANVCLCELSLILLFSDKLPTAVRKLYARLLECLLSLEDSYGGRSRVPALRCYNFTKTPVYPNYRDLIQPLPFDATFDVHPDIGRDLMLTCIMPFITASGKMWTPYGDTLYKLHWHENAPPRGPRKNDFTVPCFGGHAAVVHIEDDIRLGTVSKFPLMPTAEHHDWGLSWQSFPAAFCRNDSDWGFLQWETLENGIRRCHPAMVKYSACRSLTMSVNPPIAGRTYAVQHGGDTIILRIMPAIAVVWEELIDRLRLLNPRAKVDARHHSKEWSQLILTYPERQVSVQCLTIRGPAMPELCQGANEALHWQVRYIGKDLMSYRAVIHIWGISINGSVEQPPLLDPYPFEEKVVVCRNVEDRAWTLKWVWPGIKWNLVIDPLNARLLVEAD